MADEIVISEKVDSFDSEVVVEDKVKTEVAKRKDGQYRRYALTWNNPVWNNQFDEVDVDNTDIKLNLKKYDLSYYKREENVHLFDFKYIKYKNRHTGEDEVVERPFLKSYDKFGDYIESLTNFKYTAFQLEKGGNSELEHIQAFVIFSKPFHWSTFTRCFPLANFDRCYGSNAKNRKYCTKEETRIAEPIEIGQFSEIRERTDVKEFMQMLSLGASDDVLEEHFPNLFLREFNKIDRLRERKIFNQFKTKRRDVKVTYIYGDSGIGKTTYISDRLGFEKTFYVDQYDLSAFTNYTGQENIVFDEFKGRFPLDFMNKILDRNPLQLRGLGVIKWACFKNIYIVSNYAPQRLPFYERNFAEDKVSYKAFTRRLHNVVKWLGFNNWEVKKGEFAWKQETLLEEIDEETVFD